MLPAWQAQPTFPSHDVLTSEPLLSHVATARALRGGGPGSSDVESETLSPSETKQKAEDLVVGKLSGEKLGCCGVFGPCGGGKRGAFNAV